MRPKIGVVQFGAVTRESDEHALACGVTYEVARRLTTHGGLDANTILLGPPDRAAGAVGGATDAPSLERATGLSVPSLGARYESDYILLGQVRVTDGLLLEYRVFDVETGHLLREGCVNGLHTSVCTLLDTLAEEVHHTIGSVEDDVDADFDPVLAHLDFRAFLEYCRARETENPEEMLTHLAQALEREPSFRVALVEYVSACYQTDDIGRSLTLLDAYLARHPDDQEILIAAGNLCLAFHRVDEGVRYATCALRNRPEDVEPNVIMARFLFAREMAADARRHLEAALGSRDGSADALYCLGRYFLDLGDFYRARDYFERCLEQDPGYYVALRDLQCCHYELGDFAKGIETCELLLEADPTDAGSHYNLGLIYHRLGRTRLAAKFFEEAIRQDGEFYKAHFMLGEHCFNDGRTEEALERFRDAHLASPLTAEVLARMGDCYTALGRRAEAHRQYHAARDLDPLWENARFHLLEGLMLSESEDWELARLALVRSTELDERLAPAWNELAFVLLRQGSREEAFDAVVRAAELAPDDAAVHANVIACASALPVLARVSRRTRRLAGDAKARLRSLAGKGERPNGVGRREIRRRFGSLTWHALRG